MLQISSELIDMLIVMSGILHTDTGTGRFR